MKKALFIIMAVAFTQVLNAQSWTLLTTNSTSNLKGIHFPTNTTGYAVGDNGTILKTTTSGTTWTSLTSAFPGYWFWDLHFIGVDTGYVVGESDPGMNPNGQGIIIKTVNGGASWTTLLSGLFFPIRDLFVLDKDTLFVCGGAEQTNSIIAKSFDGGSSWSTIGTTYFDAMLGGLYFFNSNIGFLGVYESVFGSYNPGLATWLNTSNGSTFTSNVIPSSISYWNFASDFPNTNIGYFTRSTYVGSDQVYLRKTTNGGSTWSESAIPSFTGSIYGLDFVTLGTGYIVGASGVIRKTTDGGITWNAQTSPTTQELRSVCFVTPGLGFAAGANGTVIKLALTTGVNENNSSFEYSAIYPNPADDNIIIQVNSDLLGSIFNINDLLGRTVFTGQIHSENTEINISDLPAGIYMLNIANHQAIKVMKE